MLLATIGADEDLCPRLSETSIFLSGHILNAFINEVEVDFMTSAKSGLG